MPSPRRRKKTLVLRLQRTSAKSRVTTSICLRLATQAFSSTAVETAILHRFNGRTRSSLPGTKTFGWTAQACIPGPHLPSRTNRRLSERPLTGTPSLSRHFTMKLHESIHDVRPDVNTFLFENLYLAHARSFTNQGADLSILAASVLHLCCFRISLAGYCA